MRPSEYRSLHPVEIWWLIDEWTDQTDRRTKAGLTRKDKSSLMRKLEEAQSLHDQGRWNKGRPWLN